MADALKTPRVSTANVSNMWRPTMLAYFTSLRVAANSAAAPASRAASVTYDSARGQDTVTSQHNNLPLCHGTSVRPSGLFLSDRCFKIIEWELQKTADGGGIEYTRRITYRCTGLRLGDLKSPQIIMDYRPMGPKYKRYFIQCWGTTRICRCDCIENRVRTLLTTYDDKVR